MSNSSAFTQKTWFADNNNTSTCRLSYSILVMEGEHGIIISSLTIGKSKSFQLLLRFVLKYNVLLKVIILIMMQYNNILFVAVYAV